MYNAESPRMVYINPMRELVEDIQRIYTTNHGRVQYTYREHLPLSCPLTVVCKLRSYDSSKTSVK
jgi:hypothetical protein